MHLGILKSSQVLNHLDTSGKHIQDFSSALVGVFFGESL